MLLDPAGPGFLFHRNNEEHEEHCHHCHHHRRHSSNNFCVNENDVEVLPKKKNQKESTDDIWFNLIKIYQDRPNVRQKIIEAFLEANNDR